MPWSGRTRALPLRDSSVIRLIRPRRRHYVARGWVRSVGPAAARENEEGADGRITRIRPWTGSPVYDRRPDCHARGLGVGVLELLEHAQQSDIQRVRPEVPVPRDARDDPVGQLADQLLKQGVVPDHARDDPEGDA